MKKLTLLMFLVLSALSLAAHATNAGARPDEVFHQIFLNEVLKSVPAGSDVQGLHMTADANVLQALQAPTLKEAMADTARTGIAQLIAQTPDVKSCAVAPMSRRPLTLVLVPGVFAEFIQTHAFQEVFSRPSSLRDEFHNQVAAAGAKDRVSLLNLYQYQAPEEQTSNEVPLDDVILTGQVESADGQTVRVILFNAEFSTLESLGDARPRAMLLIRRLEKYLALTGDQDLAFVGYSRGTIVALEMLAQAKVAGRPWLSQVKGMVSLSGVAFGSNLADDTIENTSGPLTQIILNLETTANALQMVDVNADVATRVKIMLANDARYASFSALAFSQFLRLNANVSLAEGLNKLRTLVNVDPRAPAQIIASIWSELGLGSLRAYTEAVPYNANIDRFRYFVQQLELSVQELTSQARLQWWRSHDVPTDVTTYYAITAAMANPKSQNANEARLYANPLAYGKNSFDDQNLLQNHIDYQKLSGGVSLNDSQVSVAQAAFLPNVIGTLNPNNAGIKTKFLGIAGTHHWGMALREVNSMYGYPPNGFPREAMLRALATQIKMDTAE